MKPMKFFNWQNVFQKNDQEIWNFSMFKNGFSEKVFFQKNIFKHRKNSNSLIIFLENVLSVK